MHAHAYPRHKLHTSYTRCLDTECGEGNMMMAHCAALHCVSLVCVCVCVRLQNGLLRSYSLWTYLSLARFGLVWFGFSLQLVYYNTSFTVRSFAHQLALHCVKIVRFPRIHYTADSKTVKRLWIQRNVRCVCIHHLIKGIFLSSVMYLSFMNNEQIE